MLGCGHVLVLRLIDVGLVAEEVGAVRSHGAVDAACAWWGPSDSAHGGDAGDTGEACNNSLVHPHAVVWMVRIALERGR